MYKFPFTIEEVVSMFPIKIRSTSNNTIYADCPFCGGKSSLHIESQKDVWNCPRCNHGGGILDFYVAMNSMSGLDARKDAYHDICRYLNIEDPRVQPINAKKENERHPITHGKMKVLHPSSLASVDILHRTYNTLLNLLELTDAHRENLLKRGLTEEEIERFRFRSIPTFNQRKIIDAMLKFGCSFNGVPGFFYDEQTGWQLNISQKSSGIFVPYINKEGFIVGLQMRMDRPKTGRKYIWFSSAGREYGCSSGSPVYYIGDPLAEKIVLTEGGLKGVIAHCISRRLNLPLTFVSIAGCTQYKTTRALFRELYQSGCKIVYEALDMDKYKNPYVYKALLENRKIAEEEGIQMIPYAWNSVEIRKYDRQTGNLLFKPGDRYRIMNRNTKEYFTCSLGSEYLYDIYVVNEFGVLSIPEPLLDPNHLHGNMEYCLINQETGEFLDFAISFEKDHVKIDKEKEYYFIDTFKGIDDYFLHLLKSKENRV